MGAFGHILGNDLIKKSMVSSALLGRVSHAYIISGADGSGKKLLANAFAKSILCGKIPLLGGVPRSGGVVHEGYCGTCKSCKTYDSGNNPDLVFISPQKTSLGIEEIRENIIENLSVLPYEAAKRVYIINDAHKLTPAAQNAMLLTLEAGPKFAVFLLLANSLANFLPTILSRCINYKVQPLNEDVIRSYLENNMQLEGSKAQIAASFAHGSLGRAIALATDEDFTALRTMVLNLAQKPDFMDIAEIFAAAKSLEQYKDQVNDILDILKLHYRDTLISQQNTQNTINKIHAIDDIKEKLKSNCNYLLCMEVLLLQLMRRETT